MFDSQFIANPYKIYNHLRRDRVYDVTRSRVEFDAVGRRARMAREPEFSRIEQTANCVMSVEHEERLFSSNYDPEPAPGSILLISRLKTG